MKNRVTVERISNGFVVSCDDPFYANETPPAERKFCGSVADALQIAWKYLVHPDAVVAEESWDDFVKHHLAPNEENPHA